MDTKGKERTATELKAKQSTTNAGEAVMPNNKAEAGGTMEGLQGRDCADMG